MKSGFCSMSCTAVAQLRAHFRTVSLKGQSQAGWEGLEVEGKQQGPRLPTDLQSHPCPPAPCLPSLGLQKAVLPPSQAPFPATPFGIPPELSLQDTLSRWERGWGKEAVSFTGQEMEAPRPGRVSL